MTEDDTFERLKRIPFEQMLHYITHVPIPSPNDADFWSKELAKFNWTVEEYAEAFNEHVKRHYDD